MTVPVPVLMVRDAFLAAGCDRAHYQDISKPGGPVQYEVHGYKRAHVWGIKLTEMMDDRAIAHVIERLTHWVQRTKSNAHG